MCDQQTNLGEALVCVDAIVDGPLYVIHNIVSCTPDNHGSDRSILTFCNYS